MSDEALAYKWMKTTNGISYIAFITLDVTPNFTNENEIIEHYSSPVRIQSGYVEGIDNERNNPWKQGIRKGLEYVFFLTGTYWKVHIVNAVGTMTDTNPTVFGYTAIRAFCEKINFQLDETKSEELEQFVASSWAKPYNSSLIPDFFNLIFTEYNIVP